MHNAAGKNNNTPTESMASVELTNETISREKLDRVGNRNSKHGYQGEED